jgi:mRNA interferase RelE/StbE
MPKSVTFRRAAFKQWQNLPAKERAKLRKALERYAKDGVGNVRPLKGRKGDKRLKLGDYRIIFIETRDTIDVTRAGHRKDVYR